MEESCSTISMFSNRPTRSKRSDSQCLPSIWGPTPCKRIRQRPTITSPEILSSCQTAPSQTECVLFYYNEAGNGKGQFLPIFTGAGNREPVATVSTFPPLGESSCPFYALY